MQLLLGVGFIVIGLLSFWQSYQVIFNRDALWIEEEKHIRKQGAEPTRTDDWDRNQKAQATWWITGGVSGTVFGLWLLAVQS